MKPWSYVSKDENPSDVATGYSHTATITSPLHWITEPLMIENSSVKSKLFFLSSILKTTTKSAKMLFLAELKLQLRSSWSERDKFKVNS